MDSDPGGYGRTSLPLALAHQVEHRLWWGLGTLRRRGRAARTRLVPRIGDVSWLFGTGLAPDALARALALVLREGAVDSAAGLAEAVLHRLEGLPAAMRQGAREGVLEALLAQGQRDRALSLAQAWREDLLRTARGTGLLEVLQLGPSDTWLPDGRANLLGLASQVSRGLDGPGLSRSLAARPWLWMAQPELHLLGFGAWLEAAPQRAVSHLNRFLGWYGAPRVVQLGQRASPGGVLEGLHWERRPSSSSGPLVSVLMAARNAEATIGYAVRSLLAQTHRRLEVLVCDDASDDSTLDILKALRSTDARLKLFRSVRPQGTYNARNALARQAAGALLTFHDADDLALPNRITLQVMTMAAAGVSACVGSCIRIGGEGRFVFFKDQRATRLGLVSMMLTREAFRAHGPFRSARVGADLEIYGSLRERAAGGLLRIAAPLLLARWAAGSVTRQPGTEALEDGYRAPARRVYAELVFAKYCGAGAVTDHDFDAALKAHDNHVEPQAVVPA